MTGLAGVAGSDPGKDRACLFFLHFQHEGRTRTTKGHGGGFAVLAHRDLTGHIIGIAIEVHRAAGPGLLEPAYAAFLCLELEQAGIPFVRRAAIPVFYKGVKVPLGFRADIAVADRVILERKAAAALLPALEAQLRTYLRMSGIPLACC